MTEGKIPQTVIDEVLRRHDIVETVGKYVHLSKRGKYLIGLCPFHSEKTPSFTVTPEKQIYHCYGCGKSGHAIKFVMEMEGESFPETVKRLALEAGIPVTWEATRAEEPSPAAKERSRIVEANAFAGKLFGHVLRFTEAGAQALDYLRSRGFGDKLIEHFELGYAPARWDFMTKALENRQYDLGEMERGGLLSRKQDGDGFVDRFRDRVIFPIHDGDGRIVAFAGRLLSDGQPKYLNSPESPLFNKSRTLYRLHDAKAAIRRTRQVVLFEGYVDCIKAWEAGVRNGVASMGTALTAEHAALLRRFADEAIVCYDGDDAGQAAARKSIPLLENAGLRVRVSLLPGRMDPDEFIAAHGPEAFVREHIEGAVSAVKFQLIYLRKSHILLEEDGKIRYLKDAVRLIARRESPTERELLLKELSQEFGVSLDTLKQETLDVRREEKLAPSGDIPSGSWNNVWNEKRTFVKPPDIASAYVKAERLTLGWMLQDADVAELVKNRLGANFLVDDHAAIAAYLYAFYAEGNEPDTGRFMAYLNDDRLESIASSIALSEVPYGEKELEDNFRTLERELLERDLASVKDRMIRAQRSGDHDLFQQLGTEFIALEKRRKQLM